MRGVRGNEIAMIFQEPMTSLNPVLTRRLPDRRGAALSPRPRSRGAREAETLRMLERVRIPGAQRGCTSIRTASRAACASA